MAVPAVLADALSGQREWEHRDAFPPGPQLAVALSGLPADVDDDRVDDDRVDDDRVDDDRVDDDGVALADVDLLAAARAARRQMAWAASRELAMLAALSQRRHAQAAAHAGTPTYRMLGLHGRGSHQPGVHSLASAGSAIGPSYQLGHLDDEPHSEVY